MDGKKRIARLRNKMKWERNPFHLVKAKPIEKPKPKVVVWNIPPIAQAPGPDMIVAKDSWGMPTWVKKKHPLQCPFSFIAKLEAKGFKQLGAGAYSTVLAKEGSDKVIKVSRSLDDWIDYIQWGSKAGYAGKFVPRVYSWKRHGGWSVAVVERMDKTLDNGKLDMALLLNLQYPARGGNIMAQLYMEDLCPGSTKFFHELSEKGFNSDTFGKNVMVRKDGTVCVTDPTCGHIKTTAKRLRTGDLSSPAPLLLGILIENCYKLTKTKPSRLH